MELLYTHVRMDAWYRVAITDRFHLVDRVELSGNVMYERVLCETVNW